MQIIFATHTNLQFFMNLNMIEFNLSGNVNHTKSTHTWMNVEEQKMNTTLLLFSSDLN